jgi:hypothetical protein
MTIVVQHNHEGHNPDKLEQMENAFSKSQNTTGTLTNISQ